MKKSHMPLILASACAPAIIHTQAYANTLTDLIPALYAGLDTVSREAVGLIPTARRDATVERAAVNQDVIFPIAPSQVASDTAPAMAIPEPTDQVIGNGVVKITKSRQTSFGIVGEEQRGLGGNWEIIQADLFAQGLRTLVNEMEQDGITEATANAGQYYQAPSNGLFSGDKLTDAAMLRKLLIDSGAPETDRAMVLNTMSGALLRSHYNLTRANEAGTTMTLRDGELTQLMGFSVHETGQVYSRASGTGANATTNTAGYAVGATTITLASAGTGTILVGDGVKFAGDPTIYRVTAGDSDVSGGGAITIFGGLKKAIPAAATAITVIPATMSGGVAFTSNALVLAARAPALPEGGDAAIDRFTLVDPRSGIPFEVSVYAGYRKLRYEVAAAWGWKAIKPDHIVAAY